MDDEVRVWMMMEAGRMWGSSHCPGKQFLRIRKGLLRRSDESIRVAVLSCYYYYYYGHYYSHYCDHYYYGHSAPID